MRAFQPRVRRTRRGDFEVRLPSHERAVLRELPAQLRELLRSDDPALERLFPPAHPDDPALSEEFSNLVRGDLVAARLGSLEVMEATLESRRLDEEQILAWLGAVNDLRLVLGTRLEVTEDLDPDAVPDTDPRAPAYALYYYLGWLEEQIVAALAAGVDPAGTHGPDDEA